jgi:DNA mismatch repair protein MutS
MDEVGRGTGTEDGLAIAWAVCEELLNSIKCRTLFATHYHELSGIIHPGMANRSMEVAERNGEIVFLRKLKDGPAAGSYGLHVAALAGIHGNVLRRAEELMASFPGQKQNMQPFISETAMPVKSRQLHVKKIIDDLSELDSNELTPLEALNLIHRWKKLVDRTGKDTVKQVKELDEPKNTESTEPSLFD